MPRSHFYWEMSVGAARRTENGESTYSITLDRPTGGERGVGQGGHDESANSLLPT